uniref:Transmembrane protein 216 n=1 Tax=Knipowitschia caucasica TaxID=637954 RepID=A0AAV2KEX5_KNICA
MASGSHPILSSAPLQILLYLNRWYFAAFYVAEILMFIYKGVLLPYPSENLALDVVMMALFAALETLRIFYAEKGNLCERSLASGISLLVLLPSAALCVYFLLLQTFVLRLELVLGALLLCFHCAEFVLGLLTLAMFSRSRVY